MKARTERSPSRPAMMYRKPFFSPRQSPAFFSAPRIQPKLTVGLPGDMYEQEADRVADRVMRMPDPRVQRQPEEDEEELQPKPLAEQITPLVQRQVDEDEEEEEAIQTKLRDSPQIQRQEVNRKKRKKNPSRQSRPMGKLLVSVAVWKHRFTP